jgi:hypothetical protein
MKRLLFTLIGVGFVSQFLQSIMGMVNDCIPIYEPGGTLTCHASVAITGKRFVSVTAEPQGPLVTGLDTDADGGNIIVGQPTTGGRVLGVANRDVASGGKVGVLCTPGLIVPVTASATLAATNQVATTNDGRARPAASGDYAIGLCVGGAAAAADAAVKLYGSPVLLP